MIILGLFLSLSALVFWSIHNDNHLRYGLVLLLGISLMVVDVMVPYEVSERLVTTTDYETYDLPIVSGRAGIVLERKSVPVFPAAIANRNTEYMFLDWVNE